MKSYLTSCWPIAVSYTHLVLVALVRAAADVDELRGHLRVEAQRIERRVAGRCDDPLVGTGDGAHDLVGAGRHLGAHERAALRRVVDAADGAGDPALDVYKRQK